MKTPEQIKALLASLEDANQKGHPYLTANVIRSDVTEVVALVRELQAQIPPTPEPKETNVIHSHQREVDKDTF
jgi:hypothetical protein